MAASGGRRREIGLSSGSTRGRRSLWGREEDANDAKAKAGGNQEEEEEEVAAAAGVSRPRREGQFLAQGLAYLAGPLHIQEAADQSRTRIHPSVPNPLRMGESTGSAGCHRFTASQIIKIVQEENAET